MAFVYELGAYIPERRTGGETETSRTHNAAY